MPEDFLADYEPVDARIAAFWADNPKGRIATEILHIGEDGYIVKASAWRALYLSPDHLIDGPPDATGFAQERVPGSTPYTRGSELEVCETSAIGRCLANLGYAKGKRPSREEMAHKVEPHTSTAVVGSSPAHADDGGRVTPGRPARVVSAGSTDAPASPQREVRPSPSAASEPAPAATGSTSESPIPSGASGGVEPVHTSPESVSRTEARGAPHAGEHARGENAPGGTTSPEEERGGPNTPAALGASGDPTSGTEAAEGYGEGPEAASVSDRRAMPNDWARAARALKTTRPLAQDAVLTFLKNAGTGKRAPADVTLDELDWALSSIALARRTS